MILSRTILLVENSETDQLLFSKYFKQMGYDCTCLQNTDLLLSHIDGIESSIIMMDIESSGISDFEAVGILKKRTEDAGKRHIVIAITPHIDENIQQKTAEAGFDDYIQKPFSKQLLKSRLSRYLRENTEISLSRLNSGESSGLSDGKLYSLEMFDVDEPEFVNSIVEMFVVNTPDSIRSIIDAFENEQMELMGQIAHKLKPHFGYFSVSNVQKALQLIEDIGRGKAEKTNLPELIEFLDCNSSLLIAQLKADFTL